MAASFSTVELLQVVFRLPPDYPFAPPQVTACLSRRTEFDKKQERIRSKGKEKVTDDDDTTNINRAYEEAQDIDLLDEYYDEELDPSLYNGSVITLLQDMVLERVRLSSALSLIHI